MSKRDEIKKLREQRREEMQKVASVTPDTKEISENVENKGKSEIVDSQNNNEINEEVIKIDSKIEEKNVVLDHTFKIRELGVPTSLTTIRLYKRNATFSKIRSAQLGMAYQDYINLLLEEDKLKSEDIDPYSIKMPEIEATELKTIVLTEENMGYLKRQSAMCGMKAKEYINYLLDNERENEEKNGKRTGYYN